MYLCSEAKGTYPCNSKNSISSFANLILKKKNCLINWFHYKKLHWILNILNDKWKIRCDKLHQLLYTRELYHFDENSYFGYSYYIS